MTNILIPLNKSVPPLYKHYPEFITKVAELLARRNINVTILLFSDLLVNQLESYILIDGKTSLKKNKSISELENEYNFSFKQILYVDRLQYSEFINKTFWRNIYLPDSEFADNKLYENKLNHIVELFNNNNYSFVLTDQSGDYEHSFLRYICNKNDIPFIRYLPNFMDRAYFVSYEKNENVRIIKAPINQIEDGIVNEFVENYINGNSDTIYKLFNDYSLYESKKNLFQRILNKKPKDYYNYFISNFKVFYFNRIEGELKKTYYSPFDKDLNYIYYGFALTVESHLALQSYPFLNQISVVELISRALPYGYILYVKPHPWWSNTISLKDIKRISKMPSVKILDPKQNIKSVLKYSKGVVTLNSTSGIEALTLGKSVIALAQTNSYAELHPDAKYCENLYDLPSLIIKMVNRSVNKIDTLNYFKAMFKFSSDIPFEADKYLSSEDANKKAKDFSEYIELVISNINKK